MRAHRVLGDEEARRDLVRAEVAVEEQQHLELAGAQRLRDRLRHDRRTRTALPHLVEQAAGDGPESAASPWATPRRKATIRSGGSLFSR